MEGGGRGDSHRTSKLVKTAREQIAYILYHQDPINIKMMKRSAPIATSLPSQQQLELKSHELSNSELSESERTPSLETIDKPARRGATTVSSSSSVNSTTSDSILKKLASIDITPKKRKCVSSYRTLLKERTHSRRKNRMIIVDNKVIKNLSCESSSCVQAEPLELLNRYRNGHSSG